MEIPDLNDVRTFVAVGQEGTLTAAARELKLPTSTVSRALWATGGEPESDSSCLVSRVTVHVGTETHSSGIRVYQPLRPVAERLVSSATHLRLGGSNVLCRSYGCCRSRK